MFKFSQVKRSEQHASGQLISRFASPKTSEKSKHQHVLCEQKGSLERSFEEGKIRRCIIAREFSMQPSEFFDWKHAFKRL